MVVVAMGNKTVGPARTARLLVVTRCSKLGYWRVVQAGLSTSALRNN